MIIKANAKTVLSKLVEMVHRVTHKLERKRTLGLLSGKLEIPEDFNNEDPEINALFYGSEK